MKYNLSEVNELIRNRRTIYPEDYSDRKVPKEIIENLLENARWAPTHGNTQPWRFKVFTGEAIGKLATFQAELYKKLTPVDKFLEKKYEKYATRPKLATAILAICMKRQDTEKIPELEEIEAVACAVHNISLTATAYGIGSFWSTGGPTYAGEMKEFLGMEAQDKVLGFLYLGYPNSDWPSGQRKPIEYYTEWLN